MPKARGIVVRARRVYPALQPASEPAPREETLKHGGTASHSSANTQNIHCALEDWRAGSGGGDHIIAEQTILPGSCRSAALINRLDPSSSVLIVGVCDRGGGLRWGGVFLVCLHTRPTGFASQTLINNPVVRLQRLLYLFIKDFLSRYDSP